MASLSMPSIVITQAQSFAGARAVKALEQYIRKDGNDYLLVGANSEIKELSDRCGILFKLSQKELWEKVDKHREAAQNGQNNERVAEFFTKRLGDFSKETIFITCQVLQSCISIETDNKTKRAMQAVIVSLSQFMN